LGGFMAAAGLLLFCASRRGIRSRALIAIAGIPGVGLMSAVNFAIDSDFKWLLAAPVLLWSAAAALSFAARAKQASA
jgi:hypothetical protein